MQRGKTKDDDDRACYYWRLLVKQRVYKKNRDLLAQLDRSDRIDKVEQTVGEVAGDYERLLRALGTAKTGSVNGTPARGRLKRNIVEEDDDEEEWEEEGGGEGIQNQAGKNDGRHEPPPKRRRETDA